MHAQLLGHSQDRAYAKFVLAPNLLEQLHFGSPVHRHLRSGLSPQQSSRLFSRWAKSNGQSGPIQSIEIISGILRDKPSRWAVKEAVRVTSQRARNLVLCSFLAS